MNLLDAALQYHQQGNLKKAAQIYLQLLEINPDDTNLLHLYGILCAQQGNYEESYEYLKKVLSLDPHSPTFQNSMGNVLWYLGKHEEAIQHYETSIQLQPNAPAAHNNLGNLYTKLNNFEKAISHYQQAIELKPDYSDAYYNLGIAQLQMNETDKALASLEKAIALQPNHANAHGQLGQILQQRGQFDQALTHYHQRLNLDPSHAETYVNIGAILVKQGELPKAVEYFQKALKIDPNHIEAHFNLGSTYLSLQKVDEALKHYLRAVTESSDAETYYNIGVIYAYKDQYRDAIDYFHSALKIKPDYYDAHVNLGATYLKLENYELAITHYEKALEIDPVNEEIEYILSALKEHSVSPKTTPPEFVQHLFDQYAPHFEKHLLEYLKYQGHKLLYHAVSHFIEKEKDLTIIDLGCGTGLCGPLFRKHAKNLIGIDLSEKMIAIAQRKKIYDELITADILDALSKFKNVDLILAADVFGYFGELNEIFQRSYHALKEKGLFAFSIEKTTTFPYYLQKSARFAHTKEYAENVAKELNFKILQQQEAPLRTQRGEAVIGYIFVLQKP